MARQSLKVKHNDPEAGVELGRRASVQGDSGAVAGVVGDAEDGVAYRGGLLTLKPYCGDEKTVSRCAKRSYLNACRFR